MLVEDAIDRAATNFDAFFLQPVHYFVSAAIVVRSSDAQYSLLNERMRLALPPSFLGILISPDEFLDTIHPYPLQPPVYR